MLPEAALPRILFLFGIGFLAANIKLLADWLRYRARKASAVLIWQAPKPRFYGLCLAMAVLLGLLVMFKLGYQGRPLSHVFGETMMFVYYGYAVPLSTRISRGFYRDGIWADGGFVKYGQIDGVSWREGERITLVLVSHLKSLARHLDVPANVYGAARRVLRDKVKAQDIHIMSGLQLGVHDERDSI